MFADEIITYRVEDRTGHHRITGASEERARAVAAAYADDPGAAPLKLERVIVTMTRRIEHVETFGVEPESAPSP